MLVYAMYLHNKLKKRNKKFSEISEIKKLRHSLNTTAMIT